MVRNRGAQKVRSYSETRKSMKEYAEENTECAWCGRNKKLEVHHILPVSVAPERAADKDNMIMLCRKPPCHQVIGHCGDFGRSFVENVKEICDDNKQQVVEIIKDNEIE